MGVQSRPLDKTMWAVSLCAGAIALLFVVINLARTPDSGDGFGFAHAGPGFGIWISLAASIGTLLAAWALRNPGDTLKGGLESLKHDLANFSGAASPAGPASGAPTTSHLNGAESRSTIDELEKLIEWKNQGKISEEEYQRMKSRLI